MFYASSNESISRLVAIHTKITGSCARKFDFEFWPHGFEKQKFELFILAAKHDPYTYLINGMK